MHAPLRHLSSWALAVALFGFAAGCASAAPTAQASFAVGRGRVDHDNRYLSTLSVATGVGNCSGVLIAPRVVLSSAHCFCLPSDFQSKRGTQVYTGASCESDAFVTRYRYQYDAKNGWVDEPLSGSRTIALGEFGAGWRRLPVLQPLQPPRFGSPRRGGARYRGSPGSPEWGMPRELLGVR
jgi:hypothetical protein